MSPAVAESPEKPLALPLTFEPASTGWGCLQLYDCGALSSFQILRVGEIPDRHAEESADREQAHHCACCLALHAVEAKQLPTTQVKDISRDAKQRG